MDDIEFLFFLIEKQDPNHAYSIFTFFYIIIMPSENMFPNENKKMSTHPLISA